MMRITEINFFSLCILISLVFIITPTTAQNRHIIISGVVYNRETKTLIPHAGVKLLNSTLGSETDKKGRYELMVPAIKHISLQASCLGYKKEVKEIDLSEVKDTITIYFYLKPELYELNPFTINGTLRPDTVFGSNQFSIIDFDFFEDKYILLTVDKKTDKPFIRLADEGRHILSSFPLPKEGGQVKELYHDFLGYTNIICKDAIYRVKIKNDLINLASLPVEDYNSLIKPVIDTINSQLLFSDYDPEFPMFSY
ncbi:MAG TPA: carboxypeptidase-like regulatory domain-containing protein, partial [Nitrosopumilaceae archaeon]|nr:carboxypeptidase-like regulatory domain-containing protein [Nitrosopumilaceae archaeon]